jgi:Aspartyl protease
MVGGCWRTMLRAISCSGVAFLSIFVLAVATNAAFAQEPAKPSSNPEPTPNQSPAPQQPGTGAQVRTGSVVGNGSVQDLMNRLGALLADHQFLEMEKLLQDSDDANGGPAKLEPARSQLFHGILANRENKPQESIRLLEPLVEQLKPDATGPEEKLLRKALAEDYLRTGDWAKAAAAYQKLNSTVGSSLSPSEKSEIELPLKLLPLVATHPPMTVEPGEPFALPYDRDALGLTDVPVFIDAQSHDWMLDPTAPFNLICRSTAKQIGLKISDEAATVQTITGRPMQVHATLIPRFTLGTVTFRNMTAFVFDDADYYFPKSKYQVRGVLGYPAVSALGSLTVTADARIEVQPGDKGERLTTGAHFFLDGDQIIAALGKDANPEDERMFVVDAGGQQTYLTSRYYAEHNSDFADKKMQLLNVPGAQNKAPAPAYIAESLTLTIGDTPATFHYVQVLTQPLDAAAIDDTYGTLGMDALDELKSYTFDYRTMRFGVKIE